MHFFFNYYPILNVYTKEWLKIFRQRISFTISPFVNGMYVHSNVFVRNSLFICFAVVPLSFCQFQAYILNKLKFFNFHYAALHYGLWVQNVLNASSRDCYHIRCEWSKCNSVCKLRNIWRSPGCGMSTLLSPDRILNAYKFIFITVHTVHLCAHNCIGIFIPCFAWLFSVVGKC